MIRKNTVINHYIIYSIEMEGHKEIKFGRIDWFYKTKHTQHIIQQSFLGFHPKSLKTNAQGITCTLMLNQFIHNYQNLKIIKMSSYE